MKFTDILMSSAHAYIVEGKQGEVRAKFVQDFVKGLNCQSDNLSNRPCNECASCIQIDAGTSMDVFHMSRNGKNGGYLKEDVLAFIDRLGMGAYGRYVIGVIDEADILSEILQNKLLKTLEEPDEGAVIILATNNKDNLLSTVRSRCSHVRVADYSDEDEEATSDSIKEIADRLIGQCKFYECRDIVDKKVKTQEDAIELLGIMEDKYREYMLAGNNRNAMVLAINLIENARMDIYKGMQYSKALRRLFLELA